jgi:DNA-binding transcriptional regulator YdaS (Cro superfamily)
MKTQKAVALFGSANRLAKVLGITRQAINQWGEDVPLLRQYQIDEIMERMAKEEADQ